MVKKGTYGLIADFLRLSALQIDTDSSGQVLLENHDTLEQSVNSRLENVSRPVDYCLAPTRYVFFRKSYRTMLGKIYNFLRFPLMRNRSNQRSDIRVSLALPVHEQCLTSENAVIY